MSDADGPNAMNAANAENVPTNLGSCLSNAQPYSLSLVSSDRKATDLARLIYDSTLSEKGAPHFPNIRDVIVSILLNLYSAYYHDPERYVRYSRNASRYKKSRYNTIPIGWKKLHRVIRGMERAGLIEHHLGVFAHTEFEHGRQSRMRATPKLMQMMAAHRFNLNMIALADDETIIAKSHKDENGESTYLNYKDTIQTRRMRKDLRRINEVLARAEIKLELSPRRIADINRVLSRSKDRFPINFLHKRLKRIFNNNSFEQGGRFYHAWWEGIPSMYRSYITIDGQQTVEIDFSGMHFCIFYSQIDAEMADDPYFLPGLNSGERDVVKVAAQCMINASDTTQAIRGLVKKAKEEELPMPQAYPKPGDLLSALAKKHAQINHLFCSAAGIRAQFTDSQVAERVMLSMTADNIPVLPIHDSFIVAARHRDRLCQEMSAAFAEVTGGRCRAKTKPYIRLGENPESLHSEY